MSTELTEHFKIRSRQRFGRKIKKKEGKTILNLIKKGRLKLVKEESGLQFFRINFGNEPCQVVYSPASDRLVTIYPRFRETPNDEN